MILVFVSFCTLARLRHYHSPSSSLSSSFTIDLLGIIGLAASCETLLLSEMSVVSVKPIILNADNGLMYNNTLYAIANDRNANNNKSNHRSNSSATGTGLGGNTTATAPTTDKSKTSNRQPSIIYKFFVPRMVDVVGLHFNIVRACNQCQAIVIHVQANALPTPKNSVHNAIIYANKTSENIVDFYPQQNVWHYIEISFENGQNDSVANATASATVAKSLKSKARLDKKLQFMENNIFVNFSIGLHFIYEMPDVESSENKSTANVNSNKGESGNSTNSSASNVNTGGNTGSQNINRTDNTSNSNSSSLPYQSPKHSTATQSILDSDADEYDESDADENGINSKLKLSAKPRNINYYSLLRQTYREFFMFDYDLLPNDNGTGIYRANNHITTHKKIALLN